MQMLLKHAIDEAFVRMGKLYGREFAQRFEGEDIEAVKAQWMVELTSIPDALDAVAYALRNLPERSPNAIQFRNLCRQAPSKQARAMAESSKPVRGPTPEELAKLRELADSIRNSGTFGRKPSKQWAFDLIAKHERGEFVSSYALRCAQEVAAQRARIPEPMADDGTLDDDYPW